MRPFDAVPVAEYAKALRQDCAHSRRIGRGAVCRIRALSMGRSRLAPWMLSATHCAQTIASISELLASRLAPCSPVRLTSPQAHRPFTVLTAFDIHRNPAHVIVRRRPDRYRIGRGIDPCHLAERGNDGKAFCEFRSRMFPRVEEHAMSLRAAMPDRARDDVAGREFGAGLVRHEALAGVVDQDRAVAAHGLGHQRHRTRRPVEGGRVKLDEFEIGELRARTRRQRQSLAEATGRVGTVAETARRCRLWRSRRGRWRSTAGRGRVHGEHALDRIVLDDQAAAPRRLQAG